MDPVRTQSNLTSSFITENLNNVQSLNNYRTLFVSSNGMDPVRTQTTVASNRTGENQFSVQPIAVLSSREEF